MQESERVEMITGSTVTDRHNQVGGSTFPHIQTAQIPLWCEHSVDRISLPVVTTTNYNQQWQEATLREEFQGIQMRPTCERSKGVVKSNAKSTCFYACSVSLTGLASLGDRCSGLFSVGSQSARHSTRPLAFEHHRVSTKRTQLLASFDANSSSIAVDSAYGNGTRETLHFHSSTFGAVTRSY